MIQLILVKRMNLHPMPCNLLPCCEPDASVALDIVNELAQRLEASWFPDEAAA